MKDSNELQNEAWKCGNEKNVAVRTANVAKLTEKEKEEARKYIEQHKERVL